VADRSLVLDANILIRAVLGKRVGQPIEQYVGDVDLFAPDTAFVEAEEHLPQLCTKRGLPLDKAMAVYDSLCTLVEELPEPMYSKQEAEARARIERRDADDWPVIACALTLGCPIWTEDRDFFGAGVPTWTTDRVELFLANKENSKPVRTNEESAND
jgi:predicted nucleic acid-binding protein